MQNAPKIRILPEANFFNLMEAFMRAQAVFVPLFETYEAQVAQLADREGIDRRYLRLEADQVAELLDFGKLEKLRDGPLFEFKELSHVILRKGKKRDKLDRYANELFHTTSILKEVQYMVSTFAKDYDKDTERDDYESQLKEAHEELPLYLHRLEALFHKAQERINQLFSNFREDKIFIRSVYLHGASVLELTRGYPEGIETIYEEMYEHGRMEGYVEVARSFLQGGFLKLADQATVRAIEIFEWAWAEVNRGPEHSKEPIQELKGHIEATSARLLELCSELSREAPEWME